MVRRLVRPPARPLARPPQRPHPLRRHCFRARTALERGLLTPTELRSSAWRRLFTGVYADASLPDTHALRCVAAAAFLLPDRATVAGRSAATLLGVGLADPGDPVEALLPAPAHSRRVAGLRLHVAELDESEVRRVGPLRVTDPRRTCWDVAQWLDLVEAVVLIDRMLAGGRTSLAELGAYGEPRCGRRGYQRFRRAVELADGRTGSPAESRLRVRLALAGLPAARPQYPVLHEGRFVARVDLAWPELKLAIEYEGAYHVGSRAQLERDRRRLNALARAGWTVLFVTAERMRHFDALLDEIRAVLTDRRPS